MIDSLTIRLSDERKAFEPGDELTGTARWDLEAPPRRVLLRLFWFTQGKGTKDVGVVEMVPFEKPSASEQRSFRLRLPAAPYSFSGKLITLTWALELVVEPSEEVTRLEFVMAPGGQEVRLGSFEDQHRLGPKRRLFGWGAR
jgi:hypothetical protein